MTSWTDVGHLLSTMVIIGYETEARYGIAATADDLYRMANRILEKHAGCRSRDFEKLVMPDIRLVAEEYAKDKLRRVLEKN